MRRVLRIAGFGLVIVSFSIQSLGAESLAYLASPSAARQLMPPPAAIVEPKPTPPSKHDPAPPRVVPPAEWGYYVLAAADIAVESVTASRRSIVGRWSGLAFSAKTFNDEARAVAADLDDRANSLSKELIAALSFKASDFSEPIAPIDLPRPMPSVLARPVDPPADTPSQDRIMVVRTVRAFLDLPRRAPVKFAAPPAEYRPLVAGLVQTALRAMAPDAPDRARAPVPALADDPLELGQADFQSKVLGSANPVLVMFDVARNCHCAEAELLQLRAQWGGNPQVVSLNADDSPELASQFGVKDHPMLMLFKGGSLVKKEDAHDMQQRVMARHGGKFDSADMKAEIERFARPAHRIELYSTSWCTHCKDAKRYFEEHGIAFTDLDIEKNAQAEASYRALHMRGVPVAVIDGKPVVGFEPDAYADLLR